MSLDKLLETRACMNQALKSLDVVCNDRHQEHLGKTVYQQLQGSIEALQIAKRKLNEKIGEETDDKNVNNITANIVRPR